MIKRLARCIREYKWAAIGSPLCMIGEVAMEVWIPLVMADLYDYGIVMQNMEVVVFKSIQLVLLALASLTFGVMSARLASKAGTGFAKNLRHDMFHRVQEFSFSNIDKFSTASIVTRLTSDVANLQMSFQMLIRMAIRSPMMLILAMFSAMNISVSLSFVFCAALPILIIALVALVPKVFRIFDRGFRTIDKLNNVIQETSTASGWSSPSSVRTGRLKNSPRSPVPSTRISARPRRSWPSTTPSCSFASTSV